MMSENLIFYPVARFFVFSRSLASPGLFRVFLCNESSWLSDPRCSAFIRGKVSVRRDLLRVSAPPR
jgi:hypothetical protein